MEEKVFGRIKHKPEDFVVEEIGENWPCHVSKPFDPEKKTEIQGLLKDEPKEFVWCELEKKDIDHFQAIRDVAQRLDKELQAIGYAGTKDRFAHTAQRMSIHHPNVELLKAFTHTKVILKDFSWAKRKIKLGYLDGNHFTITIRDVEKKEAAKIAHTIKKSSWFPNYFGEQRFGSIRKNNAFVGKLVLKRDFEGAVMALLTQESDDEREDVTLARKRLAKEGNFVEAFDYFPYHLRTEKQLLYALTKKPKDFLGALKTMDRKTLLLLVNSVQSKLFNEILAQALEEGLDFTVEGHKNCILPGYKTKFYAGRLGEIEQEVLEKNGITLEDFDVSEIPFLRIKGAYRKALTEVKDLQVELGDDEEFQGMKKILMSFTLPSGVYATTYLENFFDFA